jgi:hypothetical protein
MLSTTPPPTTPQPHPTNQHPTTSTHPTSITTTTTTTTTTINSSVNSPTTSFWYYLLRFEAHEASQAVILEQQVLHLAKPEGAQTSQVSICKDAEHEKSKLRVFLTMVECSRPPHLKSNLPKRFSEWDSPSVATL